LLKNSGGAWKYINYIHTIFAEAITADQACGGRNHWECELESPITRKVTGQFISPVS
jgi:hypothetical protein